MSGERITVHCLAGLWDCTLHDAYFILNWAGVEAPYHIVEVEDLPARLVPALVSARPSAAAPDEGGQTR